MKRLIIEASFDGEKADCGGLFAGHIFKLNGAVFIVSESSTADEVVAVNLFNGDVLTFDNDLVVELPSTRYRTFVDHLTPLI